MSQNAPGSRRQKAMALAINMTPLVVFVGANVAWGIFVATAAFMASTALAILASRLLGRRISPLTWFTGGMLLIFGSLTLWLHDPSFIKIKPTVLNSICATILIGGLVTRRPTLELVLEGVYAKLDADDWRVLTRNWAFFFLGMAALNEVVWRSVSTTIWAIYTLWGAIALTALFSVWQLQIMRRRRARRTSPAE
jgi:intracellular septation protein